MKLNGFWVAIDLSRLLVIPYPGYTWSTFAKIDSSTFNYDFLKGDYLENFDSSCH